MKKTIAKRVLGTALNKQQLSTLELWQQHMAALSRASQAREIEAAQYQPLTEHSTDSTGSYSLRSLDLR